MNRDLKGEQHASSRSIKGTAEKVQMSLSHTTFLGSPITNYEEGRKEGRKEERKEGRKETVTSMKDARAETIC